MGIGETFPINNIEDIFICIKGFDLLNEHKDRNLTRYKHWGGVIANVLTP